MINPINIKSKQLPNTVNDEIGESMLFRQTLFAKTLKFFISIMAFNSPNSVTHPNRFFS